MKWSVLISGIHALKQFKNRDPEIVDITNDSRTVSEGTVFVAVPGLKVNGECFIGEAIAGGASAVISEIEQPNCTVPWIKVKNTRKTLGILSRKLWNIDFDSFISIGITGTNGKTTIAGLFHVLYRILYGEDNSWLFGTINYRLGARRIDASHTTPEISRIYRFIGTSRHKPKAVTMEISSEALALHRVYGFKVDLAVWTNLTQDHLNFHKDMDSYYEAKKRLFTENLKKDGIAVINIDDEWGRKLNQELYGVTKVTYGYDNRFTCDVRITTYATSWSGTEVHILYENKKMVFKSRLAGDFNSLNMTALIAGALKSNIPENEIQRVFDETGGIAGRIDLVQSTLPFTVVIDYAHTPDALANILATARKLTPGRLFCVFGCGGDRDRSKRPLMAETVAKFCDEAIITSDNPRTESPARIISDIVEGMPLDFTYNVTQDRREAIHRALGTARKNDCIIIAGKGHESYQEINNVRYHFDDKETVLDLFSEMELNSGSK